MSLQEGKVGWDRTREATILQDDIVEFAEVRAISILRELLARPPLFLHSDQGKAPGRGRRLDYPLLPPLFNLVAEPFSLDGAHWARRGPVGHMGTLVWIQHHSTLHKRTSRQVDMIVGLPIREYVMIIGHHLSEAFQIFWMGLCQYGIGIQFQIQG